MITDKKVIERLREYAEVFMPVFLMLHTELARPDTSVEKIVKLLDYNDAEMAYLDFSELANSIERSKRKLATPIKSKGTNQ
jgi:hypothetical protein